MSYKKEKTREFRALMRGLDPWGQEWRNLISKYEVTSKENIACCRRTPLLLSKLFRSFEYVALVFITLLGLIIYEHAMKAKAVNERKEVRRSE